MIEIEHASVIVQTQTMTIRIGVDEARVAVEEAGPVEARVHFLVRDDHRLAVTNLVANLEEPLSTLAAEQIEIVLETEPLPGEVRKA